MLNPAAGDRGSFADDHGQRLVIADLGAICPAQDRCDQVPVDERHVGQVKDDRGACRNHLFDLVVKPVDGALVMLSV